MGPKIFLSADDMFYDLGYRIVTEDEESGGCVYEKPVDSDVIHQIIFEKNRSSGVWQVISCERKGLSGTGHLTLPLTFNEMKACYRKLREVKG